MDGQPRGLGKKAKKKERKAQKELIRKRIRQSRRWITDENRDLYPPEEPDEQMIDLMVGQHESESEQSDPESANEWFDAERGEDVVEEEDDPDVNWYDPWDEHPICYICRGKGGPAEYPDDATGPLEFPCECRNTERALHWRCMCQVIANPYNPDPVCPNCRQDDLTQGTSTYHRLNDRRLQRLQTAQVQPMGYLQWMQPFRSWSMAAVWSTFGITLALAHYLIFQAEIPENTRLFRILMSTLVNLVMWGGGFGWTSLHHEAMYYNPIVRQNARQHHQFIRFTEYPEVDSPPLYFNPKTGQLLSEEQMIADGHLLEPWDGVDVRELVQELQHKLQKNQ